MKSDALIVLVDSISYVSTNCFQHQLMKTLKDHFDVKFVEFRDLCVGSLPSTSNTVLSCLKLRTLANNVNLVKRYMRNAALYVYEQDAWENFMIDSPYFGAYKRINDNLNVKSFLNVSRWWSKRISEEGLRSTPVDIWTLREYCVDNVVPWSERKIDIAFRGTIHPHRQKFFDSLENYGVKVTVLNTPIAYQEYLKFLSTCKIMLHSESVNWRVKFNDRVQDLKLPYGLWGRDIECAARSTFALREHDCEFDLSNLNTIDSIVCFSDIEEAAKIAKDLLALTSENAELMLERGLNAIKKQDRWKNIVDVLKSN